MNGKKTLCWNIRHGPLRINLHNSNIILSKEEESLKQVLIRVSQPLLRRSMLLIFMHRMDRHRRFPRTHRRLALPQPTRLIAKIKKHALWDTDSQEPIWKTQLANRAIAPKVRPRSMFANLSRVMPTTMITDRYLLPLKTRDPSRTHVMQHTLHLREWGFLIQISEKTLLRFFRNH